jgi:hypothetical protein
MARYKYKVKLRGKEEIFNLSQLRTFCPAFETMSISQLIELGIEKPQALQVVPIPELPEGISPQMSGFWNAMSKRKHFRLRYKK